MSPPYLLDVNILFALLNANHEHHSRASHWFADVVQQQTWLSCPITQSGAIRLLSNPSACSPPYTPLAAADRLHLLRENTSHIFVTDSLDLITNGLIRLDRVTSHSRLTDAYLLALACHHNARFATMDQRLNPESVEGGTNAYLVIP